MIRGLVERHGTAFGAYFLVGGASALTEWSVFWVLLNVALLHYMAAAALAFVVATFVNYLLCVGTIFVSRTRSGWKDLMLVYAASLLAVVVNLATLAILVSEAGLDPMIAKIAGTGTAFLFNFASRRFFIFDARAAPTSLGMNRPTRSLAASRPRAGGRQSEVVSDVAAAARASLPYDRD